MADSILFRRATQAQWEASPVVLRLGEPGLAYDTGAIRYGDGKRVWADLPDGGQPSTIRWDATNKKWPARSKTEAFGVLFLSTNDAAATAPSDVNRKIGDRWETATGAVLVWSGTQWGSTASAGSSSGGVGAPVVTVQVGPYSVKLTWTPVQGATSYLVGRDGVDQYGTGSQEDTTTDKVLTFTYDHLVPGSAYTFYVQPLPGGPKTEVTVAVAGQVVTANETTLSVDQITDGHIRLNWTSVTGATGYLVGRDGADAVNGGNGWSITDPSSAVAREFTSLINGFGYTLYVEPQGIGLPAYPATGHGRKFIGPITPMAAATPAGQTKITITSVTDDAISYSWTGVAGASGYLVGRDGVDDNGSGAYQTTVTGTSVTFSNLLPGTPYTVFVTTQPGGQKVTQIVTTSVAATTPGTPPTGVGTKWLSGMSGYVTTADRNAQDTFRGEKVVISRRWFNGGRLIYMNLVQSDYPASYVGYSDLAVGGPGDPTGTGAIANDNWAGAASGSNDAVWRQQCQAIHQYWPSNIKGFVLSMAHELNGGWMAYKVPDAQTAAYCVLAQRRWYSIVKQELKDKGRNVKVALNYASGQGLVQALWPGSDYCDLVAFDTYDMYMPTASGNIRTQADWDNYYNSKLADGSPFGPGAWVTFAQSVGKPLWIPEWGITAAGGQFDYDNPFYVGKMYDFFKSIAPADPANPAAGKLAGEVYFNVPGWPSTLWPAGAWTGVSKAQSAAKYASLVWGGQ